MIYTQKSQSRQLVAAEIPPELKRRKQWVAWKTVDRGGKPTKVPFQVDGRPAKSNDPRTWTTFTQAWNHRGEFDGIGFVFAQGDPYVGIDLDCCRDPETGQVEPWAREILERMQTYAEVSPSGTGIKLWVKAKLPRPGYKTKPGSVPGKPRGGKEPGIEVYSSGRYFAVTGWRLREYPRTIREVDLGWLLEKYFPEQRQEPAQPSSNGSPGSAFERARRYVAKYPAAISGQRGHDRTFRIACILRKGFALGEEEALQILLQDYNPRCQPPWSEKELRHKVEDAGKVGGPEGYMLPVVDENYSRVQIPDYPPPCPELKLVRGDQVEPAPVDWVWPCRIPRGAPTVIAGDPGAGKSTLMMDIAARITRGEAWPDGAGCAPRGSVVVCSAEDSFRHVLLPRFLAAGGNREKLFAPEEADWDLTFGAAAIQAAIEKLGDVVLVIIDPLDAFLPPRADSHRNADIRRALRPMAQVAEETGVAVVYVAHLRKGAADRAIYRVGGSIGFVAASRAAYAVGHIPEREAGLRGMAPLKGNLAPEESQTSLGFFLREAEVPVFPDHPPVPRVEWQGVLDVTAEDLVGPPRQGERGPEPKARQAAQDFLGGVLAHGPAPQQEIEDEAKRRGISRGTLQRAKRVLGVRSIRRGNGWHWELPAE